jgi:hypothetical protein
MPHAGCAAAAPSAPADDDEALHARIERRSAAVVPPPPPPPSCLPLPVERPTWAALLRAVLHELRPDPPAEPEPMRTSGEDTPERAPASAAVAISFSPAAPSAAAAPAPAAPPSPERRDVRPAGPEAAADSSAAAPAPAAGEAAPAASRRTDRSTVPESPEREVEQPGKPPHPAAGEPGARSDRAGEATAETSEPASTRPDCAEAAPREAGARGAAETAYAAAEPSTDGGGASQAPTRVSKRVALRKCAHAVAAGSGLRGLAAGARLHVVPCIQECAPALRLRNVPEQLSAPELRGVVRTCRRGGAVASLACSAWRREKRTGTEGEDEAGPSRNVLQLLLPLLGPLPDPADGGEGLGTLHDGGRRAASPAPVNEAAEDDEVCLPTRWH